MNALPERIEIAKKNNSELERLICDYMPFIRKAVNEAGSPGIEFDDKLSLAMLSFMNSVKQYVAGKGSFLAFAAASIRNRIIDESRRQSKYLGTFLPFFSGNNDAVLEAAEEIGALAAYKKERERENLSAEIDALSLQLTEYGVSFGELPLICPRQERSRRKCIELGRFVASNGEMRENLFKNRRLALSELADIFGLSEKTIGKHRKYIVTIAVLLTGDYPFIQVFLPQYKELRR